MAFLMFDKDVNGNEINKIPVFFEDSPEKTYEDGRVDHYGDRRDHWRKFDAFECSRLAVAFCESRGVTHLSDTGILYSDAFHVATSICKNTF